MFQRIRDPREDHDLTQRQMAVRLNCSQRVYGNYEPGQRAIPIDVPIKLSALYRASVDYMPGISDSPQIKKKRTPSGVRFFYRRFLRIGLSEAESQAPMIISARAIK